MSQARANMELFLVTSNTHKFLKIQRAFGHGLRQLDLPFFLPRLQER